MRNYTAKRGDKITIEIERQSEISASKPKIAKGLIKTRRPNDYLPRRKQKTGIRFFDLGKIAATNESIYKSFVPPFVLNVNSIEATFTPEDYADVVAQIETAIFEYELSDFFQVKKASTQSQCLTIYYPGRPDGELIADSAKFSADGVLKISDAEAQSLKLQTDGLIFPAIFGDYDFADPNPDIKITRIKDVTAPPVIFSPSAKMDIFFFPGLVLHSMDARYTRGIHDFTDDNGRHLDVIRGLDVLNYIFSTFPREMHEEFLSFSNDETLNSYQFNYKIAQLIKSFPDARSKRAITDFSETPPYSYYSVYSDPPFSDNPFPSIFTPNAPSTPAPFYDYESLSGNFGFADPNRLVFIIKNKNELFYFWKI